MISESETGLLPPDVEEANKKLDRMVAQMKITDAGKRWVEVALDPFHDERIRVDGYPDLETGNSVVQCIKQSFTISNPAGNTTNAPFDINIVSWPLAVQDLFSNFNSTNSGSNGTDWFVLNSTPGGSYVGGVSYDLVPTGTTTFDPNHTSFAFHGSSGVDLTNYLDSPFRLIAGGFEVVNTTPELYAGGAVTVYESPWTHPIGESTFAYSTSGSATLPGPVSYQGVVEWKQCPPKSASDAYLMPGSRQWDASKGVYVVMRQDSANNGPAMRANLPYMIQYSYDSDYLVPNGGYCAAVRTTTLNSNTRSSFSQNIEFPYSVRGAYFTGLPAQTTLLVNVVWYIEKFPGVMNPNLAVLASPSPAYDPVAIQLASEAWQRLPVGVPVGENPKGEWFLDLVNTIADVAAPLLGVASVAFPEFAPITAPLSAAAGAVGAYTNQKRQQRRAKRQKKKQQQIQQQQQNNKVPLRAAPRAPPRAGPAPQRPQNAGRKSPLKSLANQEKAADVRERRAAQAKVKARIQTTMVPQAGVRDKGKALDTEQPEGLVYPRKKKTSRGTEGGMEDRSKLPFPDVERGLSTPPVRRGSRGDVSRGSDEDY